jgi:hypothetical protein
MIQFRGALRVYCFGLGVVLPQIAFGQSSAPNEPITSFPEQTNGSMNATREAPTPKSESVPTTTAQPPQAPPAATLPKISSPSNTVESAAESRPQNDIDAGSKPPAISNGPSRKGFYFRFGTGTSLLRLKGTGPSGSASITGLASGTTVAVGGAIARGLVLSGSIHGLTTSGTFKGGPFRNAELTVNDDTLSASPRATAAFAEIAALLDFYPSVEKGWHLGAGVGLASTSINNSADNSTYYATGIGALLQGGYDWHLGKDWCLGINLTASGSTKGDFKETENQSSTDYSLRTFSLGVQSALVYF